MPNPYEAWANPRGVALKQYLYQLLKERYGKHEDMIERLCHVIRTDGDLEAIGQMFIDAYEIGFITAMDQYRDSLKQLGYDIKVEAKREEPTTQAHSIFQRNSD